MIWRTYGLSKVSDAAFEDIFTDLSNNPWSTISAIANRVPWSRATVANVITILRSEASVKRCAGPYGGYCYKVVNSPLDK